MGNVEVENEHTSGVSLNRLIRDLGPLVRDVIPGGAQSDPVIRFAEIIDDTVDLAQPATILLDVGERYIRDQTRFEQLAAPALVVKHESQLRHRIVISPRPAHIHIVMIEPRVSWFHVAGLIRERLGLGAFAGVSGGEADTFGTDLFEVANAVSELVAGPVTIEDKDLAVIAFSQRDQSADPARAETVLGRAVPDKYRSLLEVAGVHTQLANTDRPLYLELGEDLRPRLAMPVKSGGELLGSMWAVVDGPVGEDRATAFSDAARVVALALLRRRAEAGGGRRLRAELLANLLAKSPDAGEARTRLGLCDRQVHLLGLDLRDVPEDVRVRIADAVTLQLSAVSPVSTVTVLDDRLYAVVPTDRAAVRIQAVAKRLLKSITVPSGYIAVGRAAQTLDELCYSRGDIDRSIAVRRIAHVGKSVMFPDDATLDAMLIAAETYLHAEGLNPVGAPVGRLLRYDAENTTELLQSVEAYLSNLGDVVAAAALLDVHPNTMRYRLRRAAEVADLDLRDPDEVLHVWLQVRQLRLRAE